MTDQIRDNGAEQPNPGLSAPMPEVQFMGNDITPDDFNRGPLTAGHQRRSPGDGPQDGGAEHRSFYSDVSGKEAEVGEATLGPGILPTPALGDYGPVRASDFVRGDIGTANSSGGARRAPLSPDDVLFSGGRERGDYLQGDGQPSPMAGKPLPDTAGRSGSGDDNGYVVVRPTLDVSPSIGGDFRILKDAGHIVGGRMHVSGAPGKIAHADPGFGRVTAIRPQSSRIGRAVMGFFGEVNGRPIGGKEK